MNRRKRCLVEIAELSTKKVASVRLLTNAEDETDITASAISKHYGRDCFWWVDSALGWEFGQVMRRLPASLGGGNTSVTGRAKISVYAGW